MFVILRRLTGPDGRIAFDALDYGQEEGEGAARKVVTMSEPYPGYKSTTHTYALQGMDPTGATGAIVAHHAILGWMFKQALPGMPLGGTIWFGLLQLLLVSGAIRGRDLSLTYFAAAYAAPYATLVAFPLALIVAFDSLASPILKWLAISLAVGAAASTFHIVRSVLPYVP